MHQFALIDAGANKYRMSRIRLKAHDKNSTVWLRQIDWLRTRWCS